MPSSEKDPNQSIDRKLSIIIKLLSYQIVQGKTVAEGAPLLKRMGLTQSEIAEVFDSTANAVGVRLSEAKKKSQTNKSK
jgi:hypothetical protein